MTRKIGCRPGTTFLGSTQRNYAGPWEIGRTRVGRAQFSSAYGRAFRVDGGRHQVAKAAGARGRKRAVDARRPLQGCYHDFEYHEDSEGDYGVVGGTRTIRWLQCCGCGATLPADYTDAPSYDDYF